MITVEHAQTDRQKKLAKIRLQNFLKSGVFSFVFVNSNYSFNALKKKCQF